MELRLLPLLDDMVLMPAHSPAIVWQLTASHFAHLHSDTMRVRGYKRYRRNRTNAKREKMALEVIFMTAV